MKVIDISWPITPDITEYKDKDTVSFAYIKEFARDNARESQLCMGSHTGTHVDAPAHFMNDGKTINQMPLGSLIGHAQVIDLMTVVDVIKAESFKEYEIHENEIVLLRTANSACDPYAPFRRDFIYLDASAAQYLVQKKVKAVGIDYLGIERGDPEHATHMTFMKYDIPIIEGLRLAHVQAGDYFFICLPLAIVGLEASPARAILIEQE